MARMSARIGARAGRLVAPVVLAVALVACGSGESGGGETEAAGAPQEEPTAAETAAEPAGVSADARAQAKQIFESRCYTCHGMEGRGDGPGSTALSPKPRDLTSPEWQASVTDEHIANIIQYGGAAVGLSPTMPANPDLTSKPEVVAALVEHVRGLAGGGAASAQGGAR